MTRRCAAACFMAEAEKKTKNKHVCVAPVCVCRRSSHPNKTGHHMKCMCCDTRMLSRRGWFQIFARFF